MSGMEKKHLATSGYSVFREREHFFFFPQSCAQNNHSLLKVIAICYSLRAKIGIQS